MFISSNRCMHSKLLRKSFKSNILVNRPKKVNQWVTAWMYGSYPTKWTHFWNLLFQILMGFLHVIPYTLKGNLSKLWMTISTLKFPRPYSISPTVADISPTVADISPTVADISPTVADISPLSQTFPPLSQTFPPLSQTFPPLSQTFHPLSQTFPPLLQTFPPLSQTMPLLQTHSFQSCPGIYVIN